jgi:hypothetical protein
VFHAHKEERRASGAKRASCHDRARVEKDVSKIVPVKHKLPGDARETGAPC